jgi:hypothetical protein
MKWAGKQIAAMNGTANEEYQDSPHPSRILRALASRSRVLDAGLLTDAGSVEVTAFDPSTGQMRDRISETRAAGIKRFVLRNRLATFALRIIADRETAGSITNALGMSTCYETVKGPRSVLTRELLAVPREATCFRADDGDVYGWPGVTVAFPRDDWGRSTIRDALVILFEPARPAGDRFPPGISGVVDQFELAF